ncbi:MAG: stage III sporulation protein AF [Clostridia bacterium]|nr:stage III sporulation protein AF [Clostridia bacterium]
MQSISQWVISIVGVSILSLIVDVIMPEGKMRKYIKGVMAIVIAYIIMSPLVLLWSGDKATDSIDSLFSKYNDNSTSQVVVDQSFTDSIVNNRIDAITDNLEQVLNDNGYTGIIIQVEYTVYSNYPIVDTVLLDLRNMVITSNTPDSSINESIISLAVITMGLSSSQVVILE